MTHSYPTLEPAPAEPVTPEQVDQPAEGYQQPELPLDPTEAAPAEVAQYGGDGDGETDRQAAQAS